MKESRINLRKLFQFFKRFPRCIKKGWAIRLAFCDIPFRTLPASTLIPHPYGITIKHETIFGENCNIMHNVTIGQKYLGERLSYDEPPARIGNNVTICAGAIILGPVTVADNCTIGAGAIVLKDVIEPGTVVTGLWK
jgi:serine O-acetyltransferase